MQSWQLLTVGQKRSPDSEHGMDENLLTVQPESIIDVRRRREGGQFESQGRAIMM